MAEGTGNGGWALGVAGLLCAVLCAPGAAYAEDRYRCLPAAKAQEWHAERKHALEGMGTSRLKNGVPVVVFLFRSPGGKFFVVAQAVFAPDVCLAAVRDADPRSDVKHEGPSWDI